MYFFLLLAAIVAMMSEYGPNLMFGYEKDTFRTVWTWTDNSEVTFEHFDYIGWTVRITPINHLNIYYLSLYHITSIQVIMPYYHVKINPLNKN